MIKLYVLIITLLFTINVFAEQQTITLNVPTMNCPVCPLTVKKSLLNVNGVDNAVVNLEQKTAVVLFNKDKTNSAALIEATTQAGYPSSINAPRNK
jgi:mercuric ion binding protein